MDQVISLGVSSLDVRRDARFIRPLSTTAHSNLEYSSQLIVACEEQQLSSPPPLAKSTPLVAMSPRGVSNSSSFINSGIGNKRKREQELGSDAGTCAEENGSMPTSLRCSCQTPKCSTTTLLQKTKHIPSNQIPRPHRKRKL